MQFLLFTTSSTPFAMAVELGLPVPADFDITKAVCSHGLFMMAPNRWDPTSKTLHRPLRLSSSTPVTVSISQPSPESLLVSVPTAISSEEENSLLAQVRRMLRLSGDNDRLLKEFHEVHPVAKEKGFGRIFRSPTLFEDMVKCILLCNCQWPRTLSMAKALCELQLKLQSNPAAEDLGPKTPQPRETKRKRGRGKKAVIKLETRYVNNENETSGKISVIESELPSSTISSSMSNSQDSSSSSLETGDFPTPEELAKFDPKFLAEYCKLGYRAQRIVALAKSVVDKSLQLKILEELSGGYISSSYEEIDKQLSVVNGFGSYTRANVMTCMGFYNRVPADTETVRHLKSFHRASKCTIKSVQEDAEAIYGKYGSFQFLAYWFEIWDEYERRFGKTSEMAASMYGVFTASNMKDKVSKGKIRSKKTA